MRVFEMGVAALVWSSACVPGRSTLFDPVRESVNQRLGVTPEWRSGWEPSPSAEKRVKEILGRPLTAADAAMLAILLSPELQAGFAELGVAGGRLGTARTLPNPELDAEIVFPLDDGETRLSGLI